LRRNQISPPPPHHPVRRSNTTTTIADLGPRRARHANAALYAERDQEQRMQELEEMR
jgi:hypothetical protein